MSADEQGQQSSQQTSWKDKLAVISALSAVLAALLSAFVSVWVTSIQTDLDELVASKQDTIERAKLFRVLINDLSSKDKAGYALLTLWKIYQHEDDRQIVVLAALENPNEDTYQTLLRLGLEKELEIYAGNTLKNLAVSGKGEASQKASDLILSTFSPLETSKYLFDKINSYGSSGPDDENIQLLIQYVTHNKKVREFVTTKVNEEKNVNPYITYVLFKANEKEAFLDYLNEVKAQPALYPEFTDLIDNLNEADFTAKDWLSVSEVAITILLNKSTELQDYILSGSFDILEKDKLLKSGSKQNIQSKIIRVSQEYLFDNNVEDFLRSRAFDVLKKWDSSEALITAANYRACGNKFSEMVSVSVEELLDVKEVKAVNPPLINASSEDWKSWSEKMNFEQVMKCVD